MYYTKGSLFTASGKEAFYSRKPSFKPRGDWSWKPPEGEGNRKRTERKNWCKGDSKAIAKVYKRRDYWRNLGFDVVVDHIVPLCRLGAHAASNMQIIYSHENSRKHGNKAYKASVVFL